MSDDPRHQSPRARAARGLLLAAALAASCASALGGCGKATPVRAPAAPETVATIPPLSYGLHPVGDASALREFQRQLGEERFGQVLKLNRVDLAHVRDRDTLVVPEDSRATLAYSPFPAELPVAAATPKLVLVSLRVQAFAAFENGRQVRWGPTSSGRKQMPTPPGLYHVHWKAKERSSTINDEWLLKWCVNIDNSGISLHEYELPGYPASHSCVRLLGSDAEWLYGWVEQWRVSADNRSVVARGTPVRIFGGYAFGHRRPWKRLPADPHATDVTAAEIDTALANQAPPVIGDTLTAEGASGPARAPKDSAAHMPAAHAPAARDSATSIPTARDSAADDPGAAPPR